MTDHIVVTAQFEEQQYPFIKEQLCNDNRTVDFLALTNDKKRAELLTRATILFSFKLSDELTSNELKLLNNVRFIQLISAGADHISYHLIPDAITMASNTGAYAAPIAEHVLAMTLALAKRLREEHKNMGKGEFNQFNDVNKSIKNSTVGILGFGGIGRATAALFRAFGSRIFAMNTSGETDKNIDFIGTTDDLEHIISSSDIIVLSLPLNKNTRNLIEEKQLQWMKKDAILINVARGELINQKDLYAHLKNNPDFKAGLESWWVEPLRHGSFKLDYPFLELPNVLASPHNSSSVPGIMKHGIAEATTNINKYLNGEQIKGKIQRQNFIGNS